MKSTETLNNLTETELGDVQANEVNKKYAKGMIAEDLISSGNSSAAEHSDQDSDSNKSHKYD